jgi:hypothetical protein
VKRHLLALAIVVGSAAASADPHHVLVLRAEGNADDATRAKIDAQVVKLAKNLPGNVEAAEITFSDALAATGCSTSDPTCKDQVLSTMGVDEMVAVTVTALPSGDLRVAVRRLPHNEPTKDAATTITAGQTPDTRIATDIGPLFGVAPPPVDKTPKPTPVVPPPTGTAVTTTTTTTPPTPTPEVGTTTTTTPTPPTGAATPPPEATVTAAPNGQVTTMTDDGRSSRRRKEIMGMAGGGALVLFSFIMWGEASSIQNDIDKAPTRTSKDFQNLTSLEQSGDTYAGLGDLAFLGGLVLGGISGYYYWKDQKAGSGHQARITPAVFDHGVGLAFTVGGAP